MIDTHAHYDDERYDNDREALFEEIKKAGVHTLINSSADLPSIDIVLDYTRKYDFIYASLGIHPGECGDITDEDYARFEALMRERPDKVVAVGEIGLDYHYDDGPDKSIQHKWFRKQIGLAKELKLPVVIHSRDAAKDTLDILRETDAGENGGDMHCYSYTKETARELLDMNFHLGIGGVITFKNSRKLKEVVEYAPLDRLLLETDAPYLAPEPYRGKRNSSAYLPYVVSEIAAIKHISAQEVMDVTTENAVRLFKLPG